MPDRTPPASHRAIDAADVERPPKTGIAINRRQLAFTPAYAFTDVKSQGQTLECVIVDIGKPRSGSLTGFNAYVVVQEPSVTDLESLATSFLFCNKFPLTM
ncbi:hypothetical protein EDB85DRAFT_1891777 [Lactarius pseudohatsudake]|nr:hypothetical protein EDB85DRAFT_1891777 [Lactarius pseudohatsudake]